ncbi:MAG: GNAT family N-acetyltransferase [Butyrivibrio sp.]|nr:GNAT family N-acetyltransferase [Butyrivibrio sp.]
MSQSEIVKFEIIPCKDANKWNKIVKQFPHWDIYYLNEYAHSLEIHGDGEAYLVHFLYMSGNKECELCYTVMKKDIGGDERFSGLLVQGQWYDLETPYGYGGFLLRGDFSENVRIIFESKMTAYARENMIISQFVRFYPVYRNDVPYSRLTNSKVQYLKDTIYVDTTSDEIIMKQMDSKNRNMVRKAIKLNITVFHDKGKYLDEFIKIYEETMKRNGASSYYYFGRAYYEYLLEYMQDNLEVFYSVYEDKIIGAAIFFYNQEFMHYHLSGLYTEYRYTAASNLLLYEAARWACEKGIRLLHLGGGNEAEDSLFGFKKQFNKNGRLPFYVGRTIFDESGYRKLLEMRRQADCHFDENNSFMIQYRK